MWSLEPGASGLFPLQPFWGELVAAWAIYRSFGVILPSETAACVHYHVLSLTHRLLQKLSSGGARLSSQHLGGKGRWISEFEASLVYRVSSRTARTKKKKENKSLCSRCKWGASNMEITVAINLGVGDLAQLVRACQHAGGHVVLRSYHQIKPSAGPGHSRGGPGLLPSPDP